MTATPTPTSTPMSLDAVRRAVEAVVDPELPVLTLAQLGVIRDVRWAGPDDGRVMVEITPTYSGCPAMEVIAHDVADAVRATGHDVDVRLVLAPAWTTDWITEAGRKVLQDNGIAPPSRVRGPVALGLGQRPAAPTCPQCGAADVEELARFASTACQSLWRCRSCREPFNQVKPL